MNDIDGYNKFYIIEIAFKIGFNQQETRMRRYVRQRKLIHFDFSR